MRRSVKSVCRFLIIACLTVATTVVIFRYVRSIEMTGFGQELAEARGAVPVAPQHHLNEPEPANVSWLRNRRNISVTVKFVLCVKNVFCVCDLKLNWTRLILPCPHWVDSSCDLYHSRVFCNHCAATRFLVCCEFWYEITDLHLWLRAESLKLLLDFIWVWELHFHNFPPPFSAQKLFRPLPNFQKILIIYLGPRRSSLFLHTGHLPDSRPFPILSVSKYQS